MRFGLCTSASANAAILASAPLDYVEENVQNFLKPRDTDAAAWQARLAAARACGKPIAAANCFLPGDLPCVGPVVDRPAIRAWTEVACVRAAEAGIRHIVFGSGGSRRIPEGFERARARDQFVDLLRELGPVAAGHGVTLVIEPLNTGECNFVNTVSEGAELARAAAVDGVRLLADIFHMLRDGEGPESIIAAGNLIKHTHIAEKAKRTAPGVAGDDFGPYLRAVAAIGYQGGMSLECGWTDLGTQLAGALAELRRQVAAASSGAAAAR